MPSVVDTNVSRLGPACMVTCAPLALGYVERCVRHEARAGRESNAVGSGY